MSSRAFLNSFMLCPRLRARSGNFFAPNRMSTIRRMINKSGPPRFPIPKAKIFIFILNWSSSVIFQRTAKFFLVHRLAYNRDVVAFKMGRRSGLGRTVRARLAVRGRISKSVRNRSGGRRTAAGPFSTPPSGPRPVGCFSVRRPPDSLRSGRFATASPARTALKNSQLTCGRRHYYMRDGALAYLAKDYGTSK